jgi:hypothetical protein
LSENRKAKDEKQANYCAFHGLSAQKLTSLGASPAECIALQQLDGTVPSDRSEVRFQFENRGEH